MAPPWLEEWLKCDCDPRSVLVTLTLTSDAGNVRAVRTAEFKVRPHHHHERPHHDPDHRGRHEA